MARLVDINLAALEGRRPGELLLHPCNCTKGTHRWRLSPCRHCRNGYVTVDGETSECLHCWSVCWNGHIVDETGEAFRPCPLCRPHSLGEHLLRSVRDQTPGPRAANTDPRVNGTPTDPDTDEDDTTAQRPEPIDPTIYAADELTTAVTAWWSSARTLTDLIQTSRPDRAPTHPDTTTSKEQWCRVHLTTIRACEPRHRGDLCRWCHDFKAAYNTDPPEAILRARHEGQRITQPMITAALKATKAKGKKRRKAS